MIFAILPLMATSQNMYNVTTLFDNAPSGTARFVAMGGSMGALGGDLSVMGTNPAGTAIYRSSDINLTAVMNYTNNNSSFDGKTTPSNYVSSKLSNAGFLIAFETEGSLVKYMNFGGNLRRNSSWGNNFNTRGASNGFSQQFVIADLYNSNPFEPGNVDAGMYQNFEHNWLAMLASDAGLWNDNGDFVTNEDGKLLYYPERFGYYSEERGSIDVFDMNFSANINDRFYLGVTLGYHNIDYSRYSTYYEADEKREIYCLDNDYKVSGSGYDFKFGAIFRPFRYSPFKVAAFVHTPVFYRLLDRSWASMYDPDGYGNDTYSEECNGDDLYVSYNLMTPWKFGAAMSYTFGRYVALNAEYEYSDASATSFADGTDSDLAQNEEISLNLKPQHTIRLGAELSLDKFAVRAGYNYITSAFNDNAYKYIYNATMSDTSTEYMNRFGKQIVTLGVGFAGEIWYLDFAYMFQHQKAEFYPYYDLEKVNPATSLKTRTHSLYAAIGFRF